MTLIVPAVVRGGTLIALMYAFDLVSERIEGDAAGADIGAGFLLIGLVAVLAGGWGWRDGRRRPYAGVWRTWLGAGLVLATAMVATILVKDGIHPLDGLVFIAFFLTGVVTAPALVFGALAEQGRPAASYLEG